MKSTRILAFGVLVFAVFSQYANAATISPTSASTSSPEHFPQSNVNLVIDEVIDFDEWVALTITGTPTIRFGLPGTYDLTGVNIWNNGGFIQGDGEGVNSFTLNFFNPLLAPVGSFGGNFTDTLAMQTVGFAASNVAFVDIVINSSHGTPYAIFHEISFNGAPVPLPAALWLFGPAIAGLAFSRRKTR